MSKLTENYNLDCNKMKKFLEPYKSTSNYTHVSMGTILGRYTLNRCGIGSIFDMLKEDGNQGLAEIPQEYSMLRADFDIEILGTEIKELYDINDFYDDIIPQFQNYLKDNIIDFEPKMADCCLLTKDPYIKDGKTTKHGIHLAFPNTFINKKDFNNLEKHFEFMKAPFGYDNKMVSKPWLMYGQSKGIGKGTYKANTVLRNDGVIMNAEDYFTDYKIYDEKEKQMIFSNPTEYYPRIFSTSLYGRFCDVEFKDTTLEYTINSSLSVKKKDNWENCGDEIKEYEQEIRDTVDNYISDEQDNCFEIGEWDNDFLKLKRTEPFTCPTTGEREHDKLDAYVTVSKNGKIFLGCYCNEAKPIFIGTYKCIPDKVPGFSPNDDPLGNNFDSSIVQIDNIRPNEVINKNNIGSYIPRLNKADVVCMRSNMMTFKTQNLKELLSTYKRVMIVSFRTKLEEEYMKVFDGYEFQLYSDFKGVVKGDRIITQIDSLWKVQGEFDLLILDEMVYTMTHLHSFVKQKQQVWDALNQYIQGTQKIIACDALLDNKTIELFKNNNRTTWVIENKWESFSTKKFTYKPMKHFAYTTEHILKNLKEWGSLYIPTNSKIFAEKLFFYLQNAGIKVGIDSSETEPTPTNQWKDFEVFITTPTNVAGVSCNDEFGKTICYFTSRSCSADMSSQMIFRVRNTRCDNYDIFVKTGTMGNYYPIKIEEIKQWLTDKDELILQSGLKINHIRGQILEDHYYISFIKYLRKEHLSKVMYKQVLRGVLLLHGLKELRDDEDDDNDEEVIQEIKETSKKLYDEEKKKSRINVCSADIINEKQFKVLDEKYRKTIQEKLSIRRYHIENTYGTDIKLTDEFVDTYENIIPQFRNVSTMNTTNLKDYIEETLNNYEKEHIKDNNCIRLHEKRHLLKIWTADNMIQMIGFDSIWDTKTIKGFPYEKARQFLEEHGDKIAALFGTNKVDWKAKKALDLDSIDRKDMLYDMKEMKKIEEDKKKYISKYINLRLKLICNIGVRNKGRGKGKKKQEYTIQGLDIWSKGGVQIPKNEYAERLYMEKNFKRIMTKEKVGDKLWKIMFELVKVN